MPRNTQCAYIPFVGGVMSKDGNLTTVLFMPNTAVGLSEIGPEKSVTLNINGVPTATVVRKHFLLNTLSDVQNPQQRAELLSQYLVDLTQKVNDKFGTSFWTLRNGTLFDGRAVDTKGRARVYWEPRNPYNVVLSFYAPYLIDYRAPYPNTLTLNWLKPQIDKLLVTSPGCRMQPPTARIE